MPRKYSAAQAGYLAAKDAYMFTVEQNNAALVATIGPVPDSEDEIEAWCEKEASYREQMGIGEKERKLLAELHKSESLLVEWALFLIKNRHRGEWDQNALDLDKLSGDWRKFPHIRQGLVELCLRLDPLS